MLRQVILDRGFLTEGDGGRSEKFTGFLYITPVKFYYSRASNKKPHNCL
jgi:hypothetical protein